MENFDDLKNLWNQQSGLTITTSASGLIQKAEVNMKRLKISQLITIGILSTLTTILIAYFFWVGAHRLNSLTIGLGVMISVIAIRILFEWISVNKLKRIRPDRSMIEFSSGMSQFYFWRRRINIVFVPLIYISYTVGFTLLLPSFREYFSYGMYLYILISGYGSLTGLALFIAWHIKKETAVLNLLKSI